MQVELEQMIEHVRQTAPGLQAIRVTLEHDPARPEDEPGVVVWAQREDLPQPEAFDRTDWEWAGWLVATFPPAVCVHFSMISCYGELDEW
jgi:hypothetical protein